MPSAMEGIVRSDIRCVQSETSTWIMREYVFKPLCIRLSSPSFACRLVKVRRSGMAAVVKRQKISPFIPA